jgi:hypothetical protein
MVVATYNSRPGRAVGGGAKGCAEGRVRYCPCRSVLGSPYAEEVQINVENERVQVKAEFQLRLCIEA